jgi:molybdate transport system ATP-binding protein
MTVEENIYYGYRPKCSQAFRHDVIMILEIPRLADRMPANLSGGEKQRVAIARALLHEPEFLLMDEPVSALDFQARQKIVSYLKKINEQFKIPIVYVSHSISELMFLSKRVMVLEKGRRVRYDSPEKIFMNEKHLSHMDEELENILEFPVLHINRGEKIIELDLGTAILKTPFSRDDDPTTLKVGIKAKDILVAVEQVKGISARNKINAVIEKIEPAGDLVMLCCRVNNHRFWVEITPGSMRELKLRLSQIVYLIIKARSIRILG